MENRNAPLIQRLSIVVPVFNEKGNVDRIKRELVSAWPQDKCSAEFILVNDGSSDGTGEELDLIFKGAPQVRVLHHERNRGMGRAIRTGLADAKGDAVLTLDGDLSFHPREAEKLMAAFEEGIDAVLGSPSRGRFEGVGFFRKFLSQTANLLYRIFLGEDITSATSLFRIYRTSSLTPLTLQSDNFDINAEILLKILKRGGKIREVPVTLGVRQWGVSKINMPREILNHFKFFARALFWRLFEKNRALSGGLS